jgi:predicted component of type VI protein secretion system
VFESELYPYVSAKHCEILFDRRSYVLYDRSRYGTLLNDRPIEKQAVLHSGDWVRLGPQGPVLRFLGRTEAPSSPGQ